MKKKTLLATALLSTVILSNIAVVGANADAPVPKTSDATAQFIEKPSPDGPLRIDMVTGFDFGMDNILQSKAKSYKVTTYDKTNGYDFNHGNGTEDYQALLQVSDDRSGEHTGWNVTVAASTLNGNGSDKIDGASMTIKKTIIKANTDNTDPTDNEPTGAENIDIPFDGTSSVGIIKAEDGKGFGTWEDWLGKDDNILLNMPANSTAKAGESYKSTLTWTIADAPSA